jgi:hypothetical protein
MWIPCCFCICENATISNVNANEFIICRLKFSQFSTPPRELLFPKFCWFFFTFWELYKNESSFANQVRAFPDWNIFIYIWKDIMLRRRFEFFLCHLIFHSSKPINTCSSLHYGNIKTLYMHVFEFRIWNICFNLNFSIAP